MKLFKPTTGGHPLKLDDLLLLQTSYHDGFKALASNLASNQNCILSGALISTNSSTVTCSSGYAFWQGEVYEILSTSFSYSASGTYFLKLVESILPPSPVTYKNLTVNNVHFDRQLQLVYYTAGLTGEYLSAFTRVGSGNVLSGSVIDWYGDVSSNFDQTGAGIGACAGYQICNGNANSPDLRGRFIVMSTNVPAQGAPSLNSGVGAYNFKDIGGEVTHELSIVEMPSHGHELNEGNGHTHTVNLFSQNSGGSGAGSGYANNHDKGPQTYTTSSSKINATIENSGGGEAHENRPPYYALIKIMKI